jgi:histidine triad (HIT) family protein
MRTNCVFCRRILADEYLSEDGWTVMFESIGPAVPGHILVVPKRHLERFDTDAWWTGRVMQSASELGHSLGDYNVIVNVGPAAGMTIEHLHVHLIPRRFGDVVPMPWPDRRGDRE